MPFVYIQVSETPQFDGPIEVVKEFAALRCACVRRYGHLWSDADAEVNDAYPKPSHLNRRLGSFNLRANAGSLLCRESVCT